MTLQDNELLFKQLKLKLAINKHLRKWGKAYSTNVCSALRCDDPAFYRSMVDEMEREGMLTRETGNKNAVILVYRENNPAEVQICHTPEEVQLCRKS